MPASAEHLLLIVEDDADLRSMLVKCLNDTGEFSVLEADTVAAARDFLSSRPTPSVVVTDVRLPDATGEELLRWAREQRIKATFIFMTAYHSFDGAVEAYRLGAVRYLVKPFDLRFFLEAVEEAIEIGGAINAAMGELIEPTKGWVEITSPSTEETAERLREFISALASTSLDGQSRDALRLGVEEMVQNAVEWGNQIDPERKVRVAYAVFSDRVLVMVSDEGEGFDPDSLPDPTVDPIGYLKQRLASGKRIGGYGVHLTRHMVDDVTYSERGNAVLLTKYIDRLRPT